LVSTPERGLQLLMMFPQQVRNTPALRKYSFIGNVIVDMT
jgi:hypothetical protein